ncbi:hypothetical protein PF005_g20119 [Phytophthora fragariae]|uniref:Alpha/beta hydrolase fold-3 domain-containing protein n=1 Tax=Phytophthora fragariae TaxID=53985 RepID=A0A6A3SJQ9_9STRA|nr:hypothetical protein PF003_g24834 [Phytophthora fragariae]KAE8928658.1 hypothetical protein PF009_g21203 [Phytophthora fragariae]KAE9085890.1 hypothetical protein PF007_g20979 [Phytophthora fragariae]KAE9114900.1 hypothetical protein PF006_g19400 [Phytophthora fragariae]KAE9188294.1 hypothetical protein PF005_g20119 [Phytophthora fragariae]
MALHGAFVEIGFHVLVVGNLLMYFDALYLAIPLLLLALFTVFIALFVGFCYTGSFLTTSSVSIPFVAIKLQLKLVKLLSAYAFRGFKPTFPEWTFALELTIAMTRYIFNEYGQVIVNENAQRMRGPIKAYGEKMLRPSCREYGTVPEPLIANNLEHMWLRDPKKKQQHVVVIHFHGGGYCVSDPLLNVELGNQIHAKLMQIFKMQYSLDVSVDVLLARYCMAPEYLYPTALTDCFDVYKYVLEHENITPDHVVFSGDSAGIEMAITNCMRLREESPELQPAVALCYSPVVDFTNVGADEDTPYCLLTDSFVDNCIPMYLRNVTDVDERRMVSPINNSLRDVPPVFLQWGTLERFYEQGLRFKAKADAEGVNNMEFDFLHGSRCSDVSGGDKSFDG